MIESPWFTEKVKDMGPAVGTLIDGYKRDQAGRRTQYVRNLELYENRPMKGYSAHSYIEAASDKVFDRDRCHLIRSAVGSVVSSVYAPQKPKAQFQTLGATWEIRRKAYRLDRVCEGICNQRQGRFQNMWAFAVDAGVEAALQGMAAVHVTADPLKKKIVHTLIPLPDLFVDPAEGRDPTNLFMRRPMDQWQAAQLFPRFKEAIDGAKPYEWFGMTHATRPRAAKVIEIQYAWHLPDGPDDPGTYAIVINDVVVDSGDWTAPDFPVVFLPWEYHRDGFWASGIGDEGGRMAQEVGELDLRLYYRELLASGQRVYYERDSVLPDDLALNEAMVAIPVEPGHQYPQSEVRVPFSEVEMSFKADKERAFWDSLGISQVSAAARREQGVSSGIAIMTLNDTKAGRQLIKGQRYEQFFVDLSHQWIWRLRELAEENKDFAISWPGKTMLRTVKWADADVEDDMFTITVAPASSLPHDPAGRQEMVQSLYQAGMISQETAKSLIGWPDLESEMDTENAEHEYIDMLIEAYLDADEETWTATDYQAPEGFLQDKVGAVRRFASAWFRSRIDQRSLPPEESVKAEFNLSLLTRYIKELDALMAPPPAPAPAPGQAASPDQLPAPGSPPPQQMPGVAA